MEERVYEIESSDKKKLTDMLAADPYAQVSFARVSPKVKEVGDKIYLYINAEADFFKWAEEKFKELVTLKRCEKVEEEKIVKMIHEEEEAAAGGFGGILGNNF